MDDPLLSTPVGDTIFEQTNDSTESEEVPKDDSAVLTQPVADPLDIPLVPSLNAEDPPAQNV